MDSKAPPLSGPRVPRTRARLWRAGLALVLIAAAALGWRLTAPGPAAYPKGTVGYATGVQGGVYKNYGMRLRDYVQRTMPGIELRLDPSEGSLDNLQRVFSGKDTFAIATADAVAKYGNKSRLRAIARLYDDYVQLVVPKGSKILKVADLKGLTVNVGQQLSGVNEAARLLLEAAGLDPDHDIKTSRLGIDNAVDALENRRIAAFFWSGGLPTDAVKDLSQRFAIRLVPLGQLIDTLHRNTSPAAEPYRTAVIPADAYPDVLPKISVPTVAVANLMVTRDDTDPRLVEAMTRAVLSSRDVIGAKVTAVQLLDVRTAIYTDPLPLHEGARRYYVSVKP